MLDSYEDVTLCRRQGKRVVIVDENGNVREQYVYGTKYRVISDHLGSPRLIVNFSTGAIVKRISYDTFSKIIPNQNDPNTLNIEFGFAGGLHDCDTGLVNLLLFPTQINCRSRNKKISRRFRP